MAINLDDQLTTMIITGAQRQQELNGIIDRNAVQSLAVVATNLIHQHGGQGDDAGLLMSLQAAAGVPRQGMSNAGA